MSRTISWSLTAAHGQRKYLSPDERGRFLAAAEAAPAGVRTFCLVLAWSGCRLSEALALTRADIQAEAGCLLVRSLKKRGRELVREIPLPPDLVQRLVREHAGQASAERLWPWPWPWPWPRTTAWRHVKAVMAVAQIGALPACPRGLRHGFGVHAVRSGVPLDLVQRWLGHADIATTAIYTRVLGPEERAIAARMW